jgi:hypothetical protein
MRKQLYRKNKSKSKSKSKTIISNYTAFVPKTVKATRGVGTAIVKKMNYFLKNTALTLKKRSKLLDKSVAKSISSLTKRRSRK